MFFLSVLVLLLMASDGLITHWVITQYGIEVELNSLIRRFASVLPLGWAIAFGIGLPTAGWLAIAYALDVPWLLVLLVAARMLLLVKQLDAHRL